MVRRHCRRGDVLAGGLSRSARGYADRRDSCLYQGVAYIHVEAVLCFDHRILREFAFGCVAATHVLDNGDITMPREVLCGQNIALDDNVLAASRHRRRPGRRTFTSGKGLADETSCYAAGVLSTLV